MARKTARGHKHGREAAAVAPAQMKSSKHSKAHEQKHKAHKNKAASFVQRPEREVPVVKKQAESKKCVSAAGVFKKSKAVESKKSKAESKKQQRHRRQEFTPPQATPEPELVVDFREGVEEARGAIDTKLQASFTQAHEALVGKLARSRTRDVAFFKAISATASILCAPLGEEQIETTFTRDGRRVTEVIEIGKRIEQFNRSVEREAARLQEHWKQWEDLQNDFIELGVEVFGAEPFSVDTETEKPRESGFRMEMEGLNREHNAGVEELTREVEDLGQQALQKMKVSEKELYESVKKQQTRLLQALLQD